MLLVMKLSIESWNFVGSYSRLTFLCRKSTSLELRMCRHSGTSSYSMHLATPSTGQSWKHSLLIASEPRPHILIHHFRELFVLARSI
jgi:hypothetical protein